MNSFKSVPSAGTKRLRFLCFKCLHILPLLSVAVLIICTIFLTQSHEKSLALDVHLRRRSIKCEEQCRPSGTETLPKGIVCSTSDLEMKPMWGSPIEKKSEKSLLAMAVGKKLKENVDKIVRKFLGSNFVVILFHYDGNVDDWKDLEWSAHALHVAAASQTKWWFAKRFLHPDIVAEYSYIFLWDEDLGVENFNAHSYLSIIKKEGLEISQPAVDQSHIHYFFVARQKGSVVHRSIDRMARRKCNNMEPPCAGWVEMMAPVFSRAAWRCTWYLIQNDFVHGWGMDHKFGYCAQGDRTKNIGIVDSEYVVHKDIRTLGDAAVDKAAWKFRSQVRKQSYADLATFRNRWKKAVEDDECWTDPYQQLEKQRS